MKKILSVLTALVAMAGAAQAQKNGYTVKVNFSEPINDKYVYLAHYFGKGLPTIYKTDSAQVQNGTSATFQHKDSILGGIYVVMYKERGAFFQLLLDNGYDVEATVGADHRAHFAKNEINKDFEAHETFMVGQAAKRKALQDETSNAKTKADTTKLQEKYEKLSQEDKAYRRKYFGSHPKSLLTQIFRAMDAPDIDKKKHYLADGKTVDSMYSLNNYKAHFWDNFDFTDNRLAKTPILDGRLNEYFSQLVYPVPDTINMEMDKLLKKAEPAQEVYKYILHWLGNYTAESKMMGVDASFVHLVENYFGKGKAYWLDTAGVNRYLDRAAKIAPNVLGNPAPDVTLQDLTTLQDESIRSGNAPYTLLIFWSPQCGHCMEEMPKIIELYNKDLKKYGVRVVSVPTDGDRSELLKFNADNKITEWKTLVDAKNKLEYKPLYDVYSTPKIYLLDKDKKLVGKSLSSGTILKVVEFEEEKKARAAKKS
ncbi:thiol-disulfide oxidoreductase [compost metagenome]